MAIVMECRLSVSAQFVIWSLSEIREVTGSIVIIGHMRFIRGLVRDGTVGFRLSMIILASLQPSPPPVKPDLKRRIFTHTKLRDRSLNRLSQRNGYYIGLEALIRYIQTIIPNLTFGNYYKEVLSVFIAMLRKELNLSPTRHIIIACFMPWKKYMINTVGHRAQLL